MVKSGQVAELHVDAVSGLLEQADQRIEDGHIGVQQDADGAPRVCHLGLAHARFAGESRLDRPGACPAAQAFDLPTDSLHGAP